MTEFTIMKNANSKSLYWHIINRSEWKWYAAGLIDWFKFIKYVCIFANCRNVGQFSNLTSVEIIQVATLKQDCKCQSVGWGLCFIN